MNISLVVLLIYVLWTMLLVLAYMTFRMAEIMRGRMQPMDFAVMQMNGKPVLIRMTRAHLNSLENLPLFATVVLTATVLGQNQLTDGLAPWVLVARVVQTFLLIGSVNAMVVNVRFMTLMAQIIMTSVMIARLLSHLAASP